MPKVVNVESERLPPALNSHIQSHFSTTSEPALITTAGLAESLSKGEDFFQVARLYNGHEDFDLGKLITDQCHVRRRSLPLRPPLQSLGLVAPRPVWDRSGTPGKAKGEVG